MRSANRLPALAGIVAALLWSAAAPAATQTPLPPETPSHQTVPEAAEPGGGSTEPLTDKLDRSGGVIRPPSGVDPGIAQAPPNPGAANTPVLRPPGTAGGESGVKPK